MKKLLTGSLVLLFALSMACAKKKVEDKAEETGEAKSETGDPAAGDASGAKPGEKLTVTYPPSIGVYPLSAPNPTRSLYFGFSSDGTQKFEMVWVYAVAAIPDFSVSQPDFQSEVDIVAFMEKWATEFKANPEFVASLDKLAAEFSFTVDPAFITDAAFTIPATALSGMAEYEKITQKYFARRYTMKASGATSITATVDGAKFTAPVVITPYTSAQIAAGKVRYDLAANAATPGAGGCFGCHGNASASQDAFLKHSSDYLAYATDLEILNIVKNSTYPDGSLLNAGVHRMTFATPATETEIVAYLRSFQPSVDKLNSIPQQAPALRLR